jgi:predicted nucleic acid-binding protein
LAAPHPSQPADASTLRLTGTVRPTGGPKNNEGPPENLKTLFTPLLGQAGEIELFISVQNLAEMYPNLTGPKNKPPDSPELAREKIQSPARLRGLITLPLTVETTHLALDLCVEGGVTRQDYFDRQLVALMIRENIPVILTENTADFTGIDHITPTYPFE